jgi:nucleotide-binding universal stress UspA family protein
METPFKRILCGVEGNPASGEAARQAIALAGKTEGELQFTAVYTSFELGPDYHRDTLEDSLLDASGLAHDAGVAASTQLREARYAIDVLLPEGHDHDLLVLGTHGKSRATGIVFGSTATEAAHGTERPLLIARQPPASDPFPSRILFASDGTRVSMAPARAAAGLAAAFGARLGVIHVKDGKYDESESALEEQVAEVERIAGTAADVAQPTGNATREIIERAAAEEASLLVAGRRGMRGLKALGSVSERIVSGADCSVLLVPTAETA